MAEECEFLDFSCHILNSSVGQFAKGAIEFFTGVLGDIIGAIRDTFTSFVGKIFNFFDWFTWIFGVMIWLSDWFFLILLAAETMVIVLCLRSDNVFDNFIRLHIEFFTILSRVFMSLFHIGYRILSDLLKILSNLIPFT